MNKVHEARHNQQSMNHQDKPIDKHHELSWELGVALEWFSLISKIEKMNTQQVHWVLWSLGWQMASRNLIPGLHNPPRRSRAKGGDYADVQIPHPPHWHLEEKTKLSWAEWATMNPTGMTKTSMVHGNPMTSTALLLFLGLVGFAGQSTLFPCFATFFGYGRLLLHFCSDPLWKLWGYDSPHTAAPWAS